MKNKYHRMITLVRQILSKIHVPFYLHTKSKRTFSVRPHIIMLVLTQYELKKYESFVEWLEVSTEIVIQLQLKIIPHFTTLQKASSMLSDILLHVTIGRFIGIISPGKIFAGSDAP
jgi:hypothetical protein